MAKCNLIKWRENVDYLIRLVSYAFVSYYYSELTLPRFFVLAQMSIRRPLR